MLPMASWGRMSALRSMLWPVDPRVAHKVPAASAPISRNQGGVMIIAVIHQESSTEHLSLSCPRQQTTSRNLFQKSTWPLGRGMVPG